MIKNLKPIDYVSTQNLSQALELFNVKLDIDTIDLIIDLVEMIEDGKGLMVSDIEDLKIERGETFFQQINKLK